MCASADLNVCSTTTLPAITSGLAALTAAESCTDDTEASSQAAHWKEEAGGRKLTERQLLSAAELRVSGGA